MHPFANGETITLHRRTPRMSGPNKVYDSYGMLVYDTFDTVVAGCAVWPTSASESLQNEDRTNSNYTVAFPAGTVVAGVDAIGWRGLDFEVQGEAQRYERNPLTGSLGPVLVQMTRVEG